MVKHFDNHDWNNAYVTADLLSSFTEFAKAVTAAFSSKVTGIKPTEPRFDTFNGMCKIQLYYTGLNKRL